MSLHADALANLRAWQAPSVEQDDLRRRYVSHLEANPDGVFKACVPDHLTASCLVISDDGASVLLTHHRKARRWFQFGGHLETGDETLWAAAARELHEESGVPGLEPLPGVVQLSEHPVPFCAPSGDVHHLDVRFVAVAPADAVPAVSEESLDVRWWPVDAIPDPEDNLLELIKLAQGAL
ncbi:8-oxo-dGTP pyrophosphatase MutT (NUDIX family) [Nocardioides albertanoniae]|uniref:8-oxo-dGTP pyrophosphatase MutT (NUDIX family) n=1 Tax=Nocardioides albertanoniae TaxID=1175486 RepID=A0A543A485_9ACTN|nr:NUDIX domain-containing protein [Nocardioides albertanoniae]TQL67364.1 8-oxo-dGTP pyrophosphatase MutT (NUDIX family) [Nocardioides albertanoniae]